jgi:hypothetical protein
MKFSVFLLSLVLASGTFARKDKKEEKNEIIETRNVPLAITTFMPRKLHEVRAHVRLAFFSLRLGPFVGQSFDHSQTVLQMNVKTTSSLGRFTFAPIILTADGKQIYTSSHDWAFDMGAALTTITDANVIRKIAAATEVYLTVTFLGSAPPFDHMSFQVSPEQLEDVRLVVAKFDSMLSGTAH